MQNNPDIINTPDGVEEEKSFTLFSDLNTAITDWINSINWPLIIVCIVLAIALIIALGRLWTAFLEHQTGYKSKPGLKPEEQQCIKHLGNNQLAKRFFKAKGIYGESPAGKDGSTRRFYPKLVRWNLTSTGIDFIFRVPNHMNNDQLVKAFKEVGSIFPDNRIRTKIESFEDDDFIVIVHALTRSRSEQGRKEVGLDVLLED